jgi:Leucine-rich repeat (LRR) protein
MEQLPDWIQQLCCLRRLDITSNDITSLPDSLSKLSQLEELSIGISLSMYSCPEVIGQLPSLQRLDLSSNYFTSLPDSLGDLRRLQWLSIDRCTLLQALPPTFTRLHQLRELSMKDCRVLQVGVLPLPDTVVVCGP